MTSSSRPQFIRVGLRTRNVSTRLRLRWDRSPRTCQSVLGLLPAEGQVFHAKFANNEVYCLVQMPNEPPPPEWQCLYPGPGDMLFIPVRTSGVISQSHAVVDHDVGAARSEFLLDLALFYERGNSLIGPAGANAANIFATGTSFDELDAIAAACRDVWFNGAAGERLFVEIDQ